MPHYITVAGEEVHATPAKDWRQSREEGYLIQLPSGKWARLRPVQIDLLLMSGTIPDFLSGLAAQTLWYETDAEKLGDGEMAPKYLQLINRIVPFAFLEPECASEGQTITHDGMIQLADLDFQDKAAVFQLAIQPAEVLKAFRDNQIASLAALHNGKTVRAETEPTGADDPA